MADIILKDSGGSDVTYSGVETISAKTTEGGTASFIDSSIVTERIDNHETRITELENNQGGSGGTGGLQIKTYVPTSYEDLHSFVSTNQANILMVRGRQVVGSSANMTKYKYNNETGSWESDGIFLFKEARYLQISDVTSSNIYLTGLSVVNSAMVPYIATVSKSNVTYTLNHVTTSNDLSVMYSYNGTKQISAYANQWCVYYFE